eukprot:2065140-Pyramimonas_sp.AAC.1
MLIRGAEVPKRAFWYDSRSSGRSSQVYPWRGNPENNVLACFKVLNGCLPTRQFPQWKCIAVGACEEGAWREGSVQHR